MIIHPIPSKTDFGAVASEGVFFGEQMINVETNKA